MRGHRIAAYALLALLTGLLGCAEKVSQPAYAAFRYVSEHGDVLAVGDPPPAELTERGILIRQDQTTLPDGRKAVQQIWTRRHSRTRRSTGWSIRSRPRRRSTVST